MILLSRNRRTLILTVFIITLTGVSDIYGGNINQNVSSYSFDQVNAKSRNLTKTLDNLNTDLQTFMLRGDMKNAGLTVNSILLLIRNTDIDPLTISNSNFYLGVYYLFCENYNEAFSKLKNTILIRERLNCNDEILAKCYIDLGIIYNKQGDFEKMEQFILKSLAIKKNLFGENDPAILKDLSSLVTAYIGLKEYDKAISVGNQALRLANDIRLTDNYLMMSMLYLNIGVCYTRISNYSKAVLFLEKAETIYTQHSLVKDEKYLNLLNTLAATYYFLGNNEKSDEYFKKGTEIADSISSLLSLNFTNSFAVILGNSGKQKKGEELIIKSLNKVKRLYGTDSDIYIDVLKNYADFLRDFNIDLKKSILLYEQCLAYLKQHEEFVSLRKQVALGYALSLSKNGKIVEALGLIQDLLFSNVAVRPEDMLTGNPKISQIEPDKGSLDILKAKYSIISDLYAKTGEGKHLVRAAETSELIVSLLEKIRINISEEDSRLILGDRYRDFYLFAIRDFNLCFKKTGDKAYLEKAFEFSEKSKVAGLLASTREIKAAQFHIPAEVGDLEKQLQNQISFYNAKISEKTGNNAADSLLVSKWKGHVFKATQSRDSLISIFEKQYPDYYRAKYNTHVVLPGDIPAVIGRNTNYLNYVDGDTLLYIFLTNRKYNKLITIPLDTGFHVRVREFRAMLSSPSLQKNAKAEFNRYQETGYYIYKTIFDPVREFLISDNVLISPDNIISYIPFEAITTSMNSTGKIAYQKLPYLMNDYNISYTYSATFMAESTRNKHNFSNSLIAFAPVYTGRINVDSLLVERQNSMSNLQDLPFARREAEYVTEITGGRLFINGSAKESVFKAEAANCDIIHLAMHTVLNDKFPLYSKMIFYQGKDSVEDGLLNTYEVYGLPLKAKMVVLSSCNTGSGMLHTGEGILSLARGFSYSGSQSVVMSMWEIEDKSGTEIIEKYYKYLKKGFTKSNALRKARQQYLKDADMLRSHPYFWSALVIYGSNTSLYISKIFIIVPCIVVLLSGILFFIYRRSR